MLQRNHKSYDWYVTHLELENIKIRHKECSLVLHSLSISKYSKEKH